MPTGPPKERGTYQRVLVNVASADWTVGTEVEEPSVALVLVASGQDERVLWARYHAWIFDTVVTTITEWMLYKCLATDANVDMNDAAAMELLLKRGKILKRGWVVSTDVDVGILRQMKWEIYNVDLNDGEELRLLMLPILNPGAATQVIGELEYRLAGK